MAKKILLLTFISINFVSAFAFNFDNYLQKHKNDSNSLFLKQFPYSDYLSAYRIDNLSSLEKHRQQIIVINKSGDDFIRTVFEQYIKSFNFSADSLLKLTALIQTGINYLNINETVIENSYAYVDAGDYILQKSVYFIEKEIKNNKLQVSNPQVKFLINKLETVGFMIKYDLSDGDKIVLNVKEGNWNYLWRKLKNRCYDNKYLCISVGIILMLFLIILVKKLRKRE